LLTFTLPRVAILLPPKPPRGQALTLEQKALPQELPLPPAAADACPQPYQALSHRQRPESPVAGGCP